MSTALDTKPANPADLNDHDAEIGVSNIAPLERTQDFAMTTISIGRPDQLDPDSSGPPGFDAFLDDVEPDAEQAAAESLAARRRVARCADGNGTLTALFFSDHVNDIARAKAMCGLCPLQDECLAGALEREEPWGVWGGELLSGGRIIANKRPCGRPPKNPRPEIVFDELGPVGSVA